MAEMKKIEIMVLVGSNGKACASVRGHMGWGDLADGIMDYENGKHEDPEFSDRYVVNIEVPVATARKPAGAVVVTRVES
jgi:hypothetical protein